MRCERCLKDGAVRYRYNDGQAEKKIWLCSECLSVLSRGEGEKIPNAGGERQRGSNAGAEKSGKTSFLGAERRCPSCGKTLSEIRKTGYLGCADCFDHFRYELIPVIDRFQCGALSDPGKTARVLEIIDLEEEYERISAMRADDIPTVNKYIRRLSEIKARLAELGVDTGD